jgi:hypothetical protein
MTSADILQVGLITLIANAFVAFLLNVSVVLLVCIILNFRHVLYSDSDANTFEQIGKTNAVVLTMSGVLKDILLVVASMAIFGDPVTLQQYFGYSIALGGLVYYKLGAEKLQSLSTDVKLAVNEARRSNPAGFKLGGVCAGLFFVALLFMGYSRGLPGPSVATPIV